MIRHIASKVMDTPIKQVPTIKQSISHFSSLNDDDPTGVYQPNQTTLIFQRMEQQCPQELKAYAQCVIEKQNNGALVKGACEESFGRVMDCFRRVRR